MKEFLKLLKKDLAQNAGFGILAFLYIIFVRLITYIAAVSNIIEYCKTNPDAYTTPTMAAVEYMGTGNIFHMLVPSVLGCCFALLTCYYLHGRKTVDFYHSLPLKRTTIFSVKYLSGIVVFVIGYGLNYIFMLAASLAMGVLTPEAVFAGFTALVNGIFGYTFIYSVGVLAGLLTATIVTHIVMGTILMFILPTVVILWNAWFDMFFSTYVSSVPDSAYCLSPLVYFCERSLTSVYESINDTKTILIMAAGTIIFTVIDFFVCKARRSEAAGSALAFKWLNAPLRVIFSIISGVIGGFALSYMFNYVNIISFTLGFLVILVISSLIIEIIFRFDFTAALKNKRCLAVSLVLGIIMIAATCFGAKEYNTYVPKAEKIDSLAVYISDLMTDETYKVKSDAASPYFNEELQKTYEGIQLYEYTSPSDYIFENMKITDGSFAAEVLSACAEEYEDDSFFVRYNEEAEEFVVSDSEGPTEIYITSEGLENEKRFINIKCTLKSGRSYCRAYYIDSEKFCDIVSGLVENQEFKRGLWGCFYDMNPEEIKSIQIDNSCNYNEKQQLSLGEGDAQKICEALNSDLLNITFEGAVKKLNFQFFTALLLL
ncbi:MAG: DUF6449 domain-containing protein, partial [Eubacterium sp.]|nr:DUF6449 domain-containing protein [Eubacterium sp.]